ncbi:hypothetical protein [Streptomyces sp. NRRL F-2664]|uniref:hypothetical protein n=1 Tax=Streptomyces sp. NRRL F-2664 TaxID=1463842 RepID=UPI00068F59C1|nr:hypothetical protein [Streptomyces sp. NRRL F-2664]
MKLRNAAAAAVAACALVLSLPGSALAAEGQFHYRYTDDSGQEYRVVLDDPDSGECINLYAVGSDGVEPGYAPQNQTDSWVTVFAGADCAGPEWRLRPLGRPATDRLAVRSVRFDVREAREVRDESRGVQ